MSTTIKIGKRKAETKVMSMYPNLMKDSKSSKLSKFKFPQTSFLGYLGTNIGKSTTIHGLNHAADPSFHTLIRFLWVLLVLSFAVLSLYWSWLDWEHWNKHPVLTTVKSTGKSVTTVDYPSIVICGQGIADSDVLLKKQLQKKTGKSANMTTVEDIETAIRALYPGFNTNVNPEVIAKLLLSSKPEKFLKSWILTHGRYKKSPCEYLTDCLGNNTDCTTCEKETKIFDKSMESAEERALDLLITKARKKLLDEMIEDATGTILSSFIREDITNSFPALFELLWRSTIPCAFPYKDKKKGKKADLPPMIKHCFWKSQHIPCSAIFQKVPTDVGICCAFNMDFKEMLDESLLKDLTMKHQREDGSDPLPQWYIDNNEPTSKMGRANGLTIVLDAHSDLLGDSSITENFLGFYALIDTKNQYPLSERKKKVIVKPGHENLVSLSVQKIKPDPDIFSLTTKDRQCYFSNEVTLTQHTVYSKANCELECIINATLEQLPVSERCIPWNYPNLSGNEIPICHPWKVVAFKSIFSSVNVEEECDHCLPDCYETNYAASLSPAPFNTKCDQTNLGLTSFCDLEDLALSMVDPKIITKYVKFDKDSKDDLLKRNYNPFKEDIAEVSFFFESATVMELSREAATTWIQFTAQIGGLLGLCLGFSLISIIEVFFWTCYSGYKKAKGEV